MSEENLKVVITGDASDLDNASKKATTSVEKVINKAELLSRGMAQLNAGIERTSRTTSSLGTISSATAQKVAATSREVVTSTRALQQMGKTSSSATNSLFALSGVVQDAPYGFRAIANNITFFTQEMAYSAKASGGFGNALKAMGKSFLGPAGIIFAISAGVSLLDTFLGSMHKTAKEADDFTQAMDDLSSSIKTAGDAFSSGLSGASKRLTTLKLLYDATQNNSLALKDRTAAAKELQKAEPATFKAFSDQAIVVGKASKAYETLTGNVIKYAQAQGLADSITKNAQKGFEVQGKILDLSNKIKDAKGQNDAAITQFNASFDKLFPDSQLRTLNGRVNKVSEFLRSPSSVNKAISSGLVSRSDVNLLRTLGTQLGATANDIATWEGQINKAADAYGKLFQKNKQLSGLLNPADLIKPATGGAGKGGSLKSIDDILADMSVKLKGIDGLTKVWHLSIEQVGAMKMTIIRAAINELAKKDLPDTIAKAKELTGVLAATEKASFLPTLTGGRTGVNAPSSLGGVGVPTQAIGGPGSLGQSTDSLKAMADQIKEIDQAGRELDSVFQNIFSTIAQGGNPFQALISAIEGVIVKLVAAAAAAAVLTALTGGSFTAAATVAGSFKNIFGGLSGVPFHAQGGFFQSPHLAVVGDAPGGEWVLNQRQISAILNGAGGGRNVNVTGELRLQGSVLRAALKRADDENSRVN